MNLEFKRTNCTSPDEASRPVRLGRRGPDRQLRHHHRPDPGAWPLHHLHPGGRGRNGTWAALLVRINDCRHGEPVPLRQTHSS